MGAFKRCKHLTFLLLQKQKKLSTFSRKNVDNFLLYDICAIHEGIQRVSAALQRRFRLRRIACAARSVVIEVRMCIR